MMLAKTSAGLSSSRSGLPRMSSYDANPPSRFCRLRIVSTAAHSLSRGTSVGRCLVGRRSVDGVRGPGSKREGGRKVEDARQFLQEQHALHALGRAVTDRVALFPGRERPRALGPMPERLAAVRRVVADLARVEPLEEAPRRRGVVGAGREARLAQGLGDEGRVPQLRAVGARHHHAVLGHPHCAGVRVRSLLSAWSTHAQSGEREGRTEVTDLEQVLLERVAVGALLDPAAAAYASPRSSVSPYATTTREGGGGGTQRTACSWPC